MSSLTTYVNAHATGLRLFTHQNQMVFQVTEGQDNFPVINRHTYLCMLYIICRIPSIAMYYRSKWFACNILYLVCILVSLFLFDASKVAFLHNFASIIFGNLHQCSRSLA